MELLSTEYLLGYNSALILLEHEDGPVRIVVENRTFQGEQLTPELFKRAVEFQMPKILENVKMFLSAHYCEEIHFYLSDFSPLPFGWNWDGPATQSLKIVPKAR